MNIGRLIRTVRYLKPSQIFWRARYVFERRVGWRRVPARPADVPVWNGDVLERLREFAARWGAADVRAHMRAELFRDGQFEFLNDAANFSGGIDWVSASRWRLWRYQLHYFDCAKEVALAGRVEDAGLVRGWVLDWIAKNPPVIDVAWDAFTISARMLNWGLAAAVFGLEAEEIRRSYLWQARYLSTHLERDVLANHLLKNACGLCVAGALLDEALLAPGLALLREQLEEQILPDGGHYERTPMYHALVLEDLLVVRAALGPRGDFLEPHIARMAAFLAAILHPDGEIPFFGDSVLGEARTPGVLFALAGYAPNKAVPRCIEFVESGFYVAQNPSRRLHLIIKAGAPGPPYQLGHAHSDCLSYELSVDGERVIVNCGVHGYADSPHRAWCRSEAAHNVMQSNSSPQLELWGAFRVGFRYRILERIRTKCDWGKEAFSVEFEVLNGFFHQRFWRLFMFYKDGFEVGSFGATSDGFTDRIHLAPGFRWEASKDTHRLVRERDGKTILVVGLGRKFNDELPPTERSVQKSLYFAEFGRSEEIDCLVLTPKGAQATAPVYDLRLP